MIGAEAADSPTAPSKLSASDIREILARSNGPFALLEMVRSGRVDAETAVNEIDRAGPDPLLKRLYVAFLDTIFRK